MKILLVDDDKNSRNLYQELLKNEGLEIETAEDGEEGLEKIKNNKYDLILLDVMLPKMDGIAVLSELNKDEALIKNLKIVLLTNLTYNSALEEATKLGTLGHIDKATITPEDFISRIKSYL